MLFSVSPFFYRWQDPVPNSNKQNASFPPSHFTQRTVSLYCFQHFPPLLIESWSNWVNILICWSHTGIPYHGYWYSGLLVKHAVHTQSQNSLAINLSHHLSVADECNWSQKHQAPCFFFPHMWQTSGHCKGVHVTSQPPKQAVYKVRVTEKEDLTNYQTLAGVKSWTSTRPSPAPQGDTSSEIHSHKVGHNWVIGF